MVVLGWNDVERNGGVEYAVLTLDCVFAVNVLLHHCCDGIQCCIIVIIAGVCCAIQFNTFLCDIDCRRNISAASLSLPAAASSAITQIIRPSTATDAIQPLQWARWLIHSLPLHPFPSSSSA